MVPGREVWVTLRYLFNPTICSVLSSKNNYIYEERGIYSKNVFYKCGALYDLKSRP